MKTKLLCLILALLTCLSFCSAQAKPASESPEEIRAKANLGDSLAQFRVAGIYETAGDMKNAATWYRKAADHGESHAQNALGFLYDKGNGVPQSYTEAVKWYRKSADQGDPNGQSNLAKMFADGTGVEQNFARSADLYRKSAEQGWAWAQAMLAQMYAKGQGVPNDPTSAYMWCELAFKVEARGGGWGCKELLASLGQTVKSADIAAAKQRAREWFEQRGKDPKRKHWAVGPIDIFDSSGFITDEQWLTARIGAAFADGEVVARDDVEAIKWFQIGSDRGDADAESYLGERYYLGKGVSKDPARAFSLFKDSAEQGSQDGEHNLGTCYLQGIGVPADAKEGMRWLLKAGEQGNAASLHDLAGVFANGMGVERDFTTAYKWLRIAHAAGNNDPALFIVAARLNKTQTAEADRQAAEWMQAHPASIGFQTELAYMYWRGEGVAKDPTEAAKRAYAAATRGDPRAATLLGILFDSGEGVRKDGAEAVKWLRLAAEANDGLGQGLLALSYASGKGVEKSEAEAINWYEKAVAHEDASSTVFNNLAWLYATASDNSLRNPAKALHYALKAVRFDDEQDAGHLDTLAQAYYINGDYDNAVLTEKKALALQPSDSIKESLKRYEQAQKQKKH